MNEDEFIINDSNWRETATEDIVFIDGSIEATEYEVMLAIEKLTPIIQEKYDRRPNAEDVIKFIYMLRGE